MRYDPKVQKQPEIKYQIFQVLFIDPNMPFIMTAFKLHDLVFWALNSVYIIKADLL